MKTFKLCLLISLGLHLLFFPSFLDSMMGVHDPEVTSKTPERVKIRLVEKKKPKPKPKKPAPKPVVKPKPKPVAKPKPKPIAQPKPKPVAKPKPPKPQAPPKPVARAPKPKPYPKAKPNYPKAKPNYPTAKPAAKPAQSQKRLTRKGPKTGPSKPVAVPSSDTQGGRTGLNPNQDWGRPSAQPVDNAPETSSDPNGNNAPQPVAAVPKPPAPIAPPAPKPKPAPPAPKPKPPAPKPKPAPVAAARKAIISVPTIDPPAQFRRERLKGKLWVRFKIEANGSFSVSLFESSGNPEFDDFVLGEVRRTAQVQPAIGDDGQPRASRPRKPVDINID